MPQITEFPPVGNPGYRVANPAAHTVLDLLSDLRGEIVDYALNPEIPFYDKIFGLDAALYGNFAPYTRNQTVTLLDQAREGAEFVLVPIQKRLYPSAEPKLIVGMLDAGNPWEFVEDDSLPNQRSFGLRVNFAQARELGDIEEYQSSVMNAGYSANRTAPVVRQLDSSSLDVRLPKNPIGSEHVIRKVAAFAQSLRVGHVAIHTRIDELRSGDGLVAQRAALHAAAGMAIAEMS